VRRAAALALGLLLLVACRTPAPGPGQLLAGEDPRPRRLVESLHARAAGREALRASARLSLSSPDLSFRRPQRMAVTRPARLRVEILGLFDQVAALLVTDGARYQLYDARTRELEEGVVSADLLWRVARVDLEPGEAVELLLGTPLPLPGLALAEARIRPDGGIVLAQRDGRGRIRQRLEFDADGRVRRVERFEEDGDLLWEGRFDDYRELPAPDGSLQPFAYEVSLRFPRVEAEARLRFAHVALEAELPQDLFVLRLPDRSAKHESSSR